jgi:hypothetical protein
VSESFTGSLISSRAVGTTDRLDAVFSSELHPERDAHARRSALIISGAVVTAVFAAPALSGAAAASTISKQATTASYKLTLRVGLMEAMYTPAQVKAKHPTSGEVMVGGGMTAGSMMNGAVERHLEVHIHSLKSGAVVTNVMPTIELIDTTMHAMAEKVVAVAMEGIGLGSADLHYGNNASLTIGHSYRVTVVVRGETATFNFKAA